MALAIILPREPPRGAHVYLEKLGSDLGGTELHSAPFSFCVKFSLLITCTARSGSTSGYYTDRQLCYFSEGS